MPKFICDRSGFVGHEGDMVKQWDGQMVLSRFAETRQPQDFPAKPRIERPVRNARPEGPDVFLSPGDVTAGDL